MRNSRYQTTDAVILKYTKSGEQNRYFTFLSPLLGIAQATAFGAEKPGSRFCASVQSMVRAELYLDRDPKNGLIRLKDMGSIDLYHQLKSDLSAIFLFSFYSDVLLQCYFSADEYKTYYYLLVYSLELMSEDAGLKRSFLFFTAKLIYLSGISVGLTGCRNCSSQTDRYFFEWKNHGIFCPSCSSSQKNLLYSNDLEVFQYFIDEKKAKISGIQIPDESFNRLYPVLKEFILVWLEKEPVTLKLLDEVFSLK